MKRNYAGPKGVTMSHPELIEHVECIEVRSRMRVGMRVLVAAFGLIPLLAPYELLIKIDWNHFINPFFFFAAFISAGATAVSALFFFAAVAGLNSIIVFDRRAATFSYFQKAPVIRGTRQVQPLQDICNIDVGVRDWSDGAPTYYLRVTMKNGSVFESGSSWARKDIERIRSRIEHFLKASSS
jgi:hypothetical protein